MTSHLSPEDLDLLVEGAAEPEEALRAEAHLAACGACRALRDRRAAFIEAAFGLPDLEVPPDLAARIVARAFPERRRLVPALAALAGGLSLAVFGGLAYVLATGESFAGFFLGLGKASWGLARESTLALLKVLKLGTLFLTILGRFAEEITRAAGHVGATIPVQVYAACFAAALALAAAAAFGIRRKIAQGERP